MGLASTKTLGTWPAVLQPFPLAQLTNSRVRVALAGSILDGLMRHTPEGMQFVRTAHDQGVQAAVAKRDGEPWNDYSQVRLVAPRARAAALFMRCS